MTTVTEYVEYMENRGFKLTAKLGEKCVMVNEDKSEEFITVKSIKLGQKIGRLDGSDAKGDNLIFKLDLRKGKWRIAIESIFQNTIIYKVPRGGAFLKME